MREALTNPMFELVPYEAGESGIMTHGHRKDTETGLSFVASQLRVADGGARDSSIVLFQTRLFATHTLTPAAALCELALCNRRLPCA